jgi:hypothetical protein
MINLLFWLLTLAGVVALLVFAWQSAMRRRGYRLVDLLGEEGVVRHAISVPVRIGTGGAGSPVLPRRGTVVLTRRRLAGFTHRSRFVLVRGAGSRNSRLTAADGWLVIRQDGSRGGAGTELRFRVGDAAADWARDASRILHGR